eukprot:6197139-Pleurochrysis_carterae.AAC.1
MSPHALLAGATHPTIVCRTRMVTHLFKLVNDRVLPQKFSDTNLVISLHSSSVLLFAYDATNRLKSARSDRKRDQRATGVIKVVSGLANDHYEV